ncbi:MAG TPA: hypothetical protein VIV55_06610 [Flavobacterium sp.]
MKDEKYFNFPIQLLSGFMNNTSKTLNNISYYALYRNLLELEYGTELEKINESASFYGLSLGNSKKALSDGKELYNSIPRNSPRVGISTVMFWDFCNNEKTEFDKICLLGFLGIKSIIGSKAYCKTGNLFWLSRMDGKVNKVNDASELSDEVRKYANEYQTKKIKTALRNGWALVTYSRHCYGFYVSFKITLKQLMTEAEKRRISTKEKQYKQQEKDLLKEVLNELKATRP